MLFFCEECGSRNLIPDGDDSQKTVRFRCIACNFENVWQEPDVSCKTEKQKKPMGRCGKTG